MNKFIALIVVVLSISGCASLGIGADNYSCKGYPNHPGCLSSREVYKQTNYRDTLFSEDDYTHHKKQQDTKKPTADDTTNDDFANDDDNDYFDDQRNPTKQVNISKSKKNNLHEKNKTVLGQNRYIPRMIDGVLPVRTQAKVMRIWIAPWEDDEDAFHSPGLVYQEIEKRHWSLGDSNHTRTRYFSPLSRQ